MRNLTPYEKQQNELAEFKTYLADRVNGLLFGSKNKFVCEWIKSNDLRIEFDGNFAFTIFITNKSKIRVYDTFIDLGDVDNAIDAGIISQLLANYQELHDLRDKFQQLTNATWDFENKTYSTSAHDKVIESMITEIEYHKGTFLDGSTSRTLEYPDQDFTVDIVQWSQANHVIIGVTNNTSGATYGYTTEVEKADIADKLRFYFTELYYNV